mmetsp:Transcript_18143/g.39128  ORF Transcript_18143/g.39128 Transcript_18143/m.39128 type:complete len:265 (-) Transcript_18143:749-1543(-)
MPREPDLPVLALLANFITSGSSATPSTSNMNSSGTGGAVSSCSSWASSCSSSSFSGSSVSSCCCGGGGGGGCCIISSSGGAEICVPRGAMHNRTPILRSSASTRSRPLSAAFARAASTAKISPRWPCTPARTASSHRYLACSLLTRRPFRYSRAKMIDVRIWSSTSPYDLMKACGSAAKSRARWTASSLSSCASGSASAERHVPMRSIRCSRSSASSGLNVAISSGRHGWRTESPSLSTVTHPVESASRSRLDALSSSRLMSST